MSVSNSQTLTISGQDLSRNGSNRAPWEDAKANLKPSTPSRKPKPVSITSYCSLSQEPVSFCKVLSARRIFMAYIDYSLLYALNN